MEIHGDLNFFGGTFLENVNDDDHDDDDDHDNDEKSFLEALLSKLSERLKTEG